MTSKDILGYFFEKRFEYKRLKKLTTIGLRAFYKREELNYLPQQMTPEEFFELYTAHATNLGAGSEPLTGEQLERGLSGGWTAPINKLSPSFSYSQKNYRPGHQIILVPLPYASATDAGVIEKGYKPRAAEVAVITENEYVPFAGYDHNGVSYPYGVDFIKLFNVGTDSFG